MRTFCIKWEPNKDHFSSLVLHVMDQTALFGKYFWPTLWRTSTVIGWRAFRTEISRILFSGNVSFTFLNKDQMHHIFTITTFVNSKSTSSGESWTILAKPILLERKTDIEDNGPGGSWLCVLCLIYLNINLAHIHLPGHFSRQVTSSPTCKSKRELAGALMHFF